MGKIPKFNELLALTDHELVDRYDAEAQHTEVGTRFYLEELTRRAQAKQTEQMLAISKHVRNLTILIAVLTIANVALVAVTLSQ